jgi:hypothetical protein
LRNTREFGERVLAHIRFSLDKFSRLSECWSWRLPIT